MDEKKSLLAIPVLRSRVAPVFNWCSRVHIYSGGGPVPIQFHEEMDLGQLTPFKRLEALRGRGVRVLICGALSPDLQTYGEQIGLSIIAGVAGEIVEVVQAFGSRELDLPRFWLPGCQGPRRYRGRCASGGGPCQEAGSGKAPSEPRSRTGGARTGASKTGSDARDRGGPGGLCVCPLCGNTVPHRRGIPCAQMLCPRCQHAMVRE